MPEIVGAFARTELRDEGANCSGEARNGSGRDLTEERLEFAVWQLDRVEVGRVFRQVAQGLVSRVAPVQTAMRNCTRDEGRSFEFGNQVLISSHRKAAVVKSHGGERCGKVGT